MVKGHEAAEAGHTDGLLLCPGLLPPTSSCAGGVEVLKFTTSALLGGSSIISADRCGLLWSWGAWTPGVKIGLSPSLQSSDQELSRFPLAWQLESEVWDMNKFYGKPHPAVIKKSSLRLCAGSKFWTALLICRQNCFSTLNDQLEKTSSELHQGGIAPFEDTVHPKQNAGVGELDNRFPSQLQTDNGPRI